MAVARPDSVRDVHVEDARAALEEALGSCPLAPESLRHPTFSAVVTVLLRLTAQGFARGLFDEDELSRGSMVEPEEQAMLLAKLFALFGALTGTRVAIRPSEVLAGTAPEQTLRFIAGLASLKTTTAPEVVAGAVRRVTDSMAAPRAAKAKPGTKKKRRKRSAAPRGTVPARGVEAGGTTDPVAPLSVSIVTGGASAGLSPDPSRSLPPRAQRAGAAASASSLSSSSSSAALPQSRPPRAGSSVRTSRKKKKGTAKTSAGADTAGPAARPAPDPLSSSSRSPDLDTPLGGFEPSSSGLSTRRRPKHGPAASAIALPPAAEEAASLGGRNLFDQEWLGNFDFRLRSLVRQLHGHQYGRPDAAPLPGRVRERRQADADGNEIVPDVGGIISGVGMLSPAQMRGAGVAATGGGRADR